MRNWWVKKRNRSWMETEMRFILILQCSNVETVLKNKCKTPYFVIYYLEFKDLNANWMPCFSEMKYQMKEFVIIRFIYKSYACSLFVISNQQALKDEKGEWEKNNTIDTETGFSPCQFAIINITWCVTAK